MRIALVGLTHPFRGGISHYSTLLYRALALSHDVEFFALSRQYPEFLFPGKTQKDESSMTLAVPNQACLDSIDPTTWIGTTARIRRFRPDFLLFSWWHPFFAPAFGTVAHLARLQRMPSCFLCHNVIPHERSRVDVALLHYAFSAARAFIAHSHQDAKDLLRLRPRATVLENPHPTYEAFAPELVPSTEDAKRALGLDGKRVLLFFGFIREYKGLDVLLAAMAELPASEGYHLLVVGEFYEDRARYQPAIDSLTGRGQITVIDRYVPNEDLPGFFAAADVVVVPYRSATQSGIVQLAYGFEKPVIATRVGGLPEVVMDGETGALVESEDPAAIAAAARRLVAPGQAERLRAGIARERHRFSWARMVETIEEIGRSLGCQSAPRRGPVAIRVKP